MFKHCELSHTHSGVVTQDGSFAGDNPSPVRAPKLVMRKCYPEQIKFGFIAAGSDAELTAQFGETSSSKPSKVFSTKRPACAGKPERIFLT